MAKQKSPGTIKRASIGIKDVIRDFVFGMEDGLVSNLGLVLGVYVGGGSAFTVILAGLASMFTGAFSMSAGSYLSAKSQREVYEQEIAATKEKLRRNPKKCLLKIRKILKKEGFDRNEIPLICRHFVRHKKATFIKNYIQKKVGLSEARFELPLKNAFTMFFSFLVGSLFPVLPFILFSLETFSLATAAIVAVIMTAIALFLVGLVKTIYTKRNWFKSGMEIVLVGLGAGVLGYFVGLLVSLL